MDTQVIIYHLEMTDPAELRSSPTPEIDRDCAPGRGYASRVPHTRPFCIEVKQAKIPCPELNRFLYTTVGADWQWTDRLGWTREQWLQYVDRAEMETWVAYVAGTPAGYFELEMQPGANVEIAYFGLLPQFIGRGIGGYLLTVAVQRAWAMGAARVWVHTCMMDHPGALSNYQARGFRIFKEETAS